MMEAIIGAGAALLGTLAGGLTQWAAARATRTQTDRAARHTAVATLAAALADHRRAMWVREDARLSGADPDELAALRHPTTHTELTDRRDTALTAEQTLIDTAATH